MTAALSATDIIAEHTVRITEGGLEFTCHGDRNSDCHRYPDCECESWDADHEVEHGHARVPHDQCWMQDWFDNDGTDPCRKTLEECEFLPGMEGPIKASFCFDYVEWEFIEPAKEVGGQQ